MAVRECPELSITPLSAQPEASSNPAGRHRYALLTCSCACDVEVSHLLPVSGLEARSKHHGTETLAQHQEPLNIGLK